MPLLYTVWVIAVSAAVIYALLQQERFRKFMDKEQALDAAIAAVPGAVAAAIQPTIDAVVAKLNSIPGAQLDDEIASVTALPDTIASAIAAAFEPVLTPPADQAL